MNNMSPQIKFVGTGGIFDYKIGNSAALIYMDFGKVLIDCGYTIFGTLKDKHLIKDIDFLLITHLHGDHVGSIHPLIIDYLTTKNKKLKIIYTDDVFKSEVDIYLTHFLVTPTDYIEYVPITDFPEIGFIDTKGAHFEGLQTYAYYFATGDDLLYYSGDLGDINLTIKFLDSVRVKNVEVFHELSFKEGKAHVYYKELGLRLNNYNVYGYHCDHTNAPNDNSIKLVANFPHLNI